MKTKLLPRFLMAALLLFSLQSLANNPNESIMNTDSFDTIKLLKPNTKGGKPLMKLVSSRRSDRNFADKDLSLRQISEIVWVANGINRADGKRTIPSAMGIYPLDLYVFTKNAVYLYSPEEHILIPVLKGDHRESTGCQVFVKEAPINLVFIADLSRYEGKVKRTKEAFYHSASLDVGHATQNVYLYAAQEKLKAVVRAMADEKKLIKLLNLDENHRFIIAQTIGY